MASVEETLTEPAVVAGQAIALITVVTLIVRMIVAPAIGYIQVTMRKVHVLGELVERELAPNGGDSIKDRVADLQGKLAMVSRELWEVEQHQKLMAIELNQVIMKQMEFGRNQQSTIETIDRMADSIEEGKEHKADG